MLGAGLALMLWYATPRQRRLGQGVWMLASAIMLRELAPFHFSSQAGRFSWIPFYSTLAGDGTARGDSARQGFDYGAAVWVLHADGFSYISAGGFTAAAYFLELGQLYLPGRTPESTDAVLALLMTLALWLASDFRPRRSYD